MQVIVPALTAAHNTFTQNREQIIQQWVSYEGPKQILILHGIEEKFFLNKYAGGVFDYFMDIIVGKVDIGHCPVMQELLTYLKKREISADELFEICSHFRRSMIDFSYDAKLNSKELFDEISFIFDKNFKGILKFYTDTIFQKLIDARQDAIKASQAKEYFLSNMSHEIRTPLNAILGFVNLLLEEEISKKHRNYLDIIHNSGENLLSIINDILDFSKLRSGEFALEYKNFSIHEELSHTIELFVASANVKDITLLSYIDPKIPQELNGDALRIKQILSNFLSNAIKFTQESGVITIDVSYRNSFLSMSVKDSGIGISKEDINKIFTAFAQAQYSVHLNKGGTGLGLSICNQLAEKMGGKVSVLSELNKGSTFSLEIPIEAVDEHLDIFSNLDEYRNLNIAIYAKNFEIENKHKSFLRYADIFKKRIEIVDSLENDFDITLFVFENLESLEKDIIMKSSKKLIALMSRDYDDFEKYKYKHINKICFPLYFSKIKMVFDEVLHPTKIYTYNKNRLSQYKGHILVAEDNEANQELIKIVLQKYGLTYNLVENGKVAYESFQDSKYDLVLMDQQMPIMNGNDAVHHIIEYEKREGLSHTPIAALTANVIKGTKERGLSNGYDAFLGKPLILKELEHVFQKYLQEEYVVSQNRVENTEDMTNESIVGLDTKKLIKELLLTKEELITLLKLFLKKMQKTLPELEYSISKLEYSKIALLAHSIKGSSGNFRIKELQDLASKMEEKAKLEDSMYDYKTELFNIKEICKAIYIKK